MDHNVDQFVLQLLRVTDQASSLQRILSTSSAEYLICGGFILFIAQQKVDAKKILRKQLSSCHLQGVLCCMF